MNEQIWRQTITNRRRVKARALKDRQDQKGRRSHPSSHRLRPGGDQGGGRKRRPTGLAQIGDGVDEEDAPKIKPLALDPSEYDIVVIGTPMWAANMSSPIRAFITEHKNDINTTALFCTGDGDEPEKVFIPLSELLGKEPLATLGLIGPDREGEIATLKIQVFAEKISV